MKAKHYERILQRVVTSSWLPLCVGACILVVAVAQVHGQCNNGANVTSTALINPVANGATGSFSATYDTLTAGTCGYSNVTLSYFCPDATGAPNGPEVVVGMIPFLPAGVGVTDFPGSPFACFINVNPGVNSATFKPRLTGTLLDIPGGTPNTVIEKPISVVVVRPCIDVVKQVACKPADVTCQNVSPGDYSGQATGLTGSTFCYRIIVSNCTTGAFPLTIHSVSDNQLGNLIGIFPANTTLASGSSATGFVSAVVSADTINTVTVTATNGAISKSDSASATVDVVQASISCTKQVESVDGVPQNVQNLVLNNDTLDHLVVWSIVVTNDGQAPLSVTVSDSPFNNTDACSPALPALIQLEPGVSQTYRCSEIVNCTNLPNGEVLINTNIVTATVGNFDEIEVCPTTVVLTNTCTATVRCEGTCITRTEGFWYPRPSSADPNCPTLLAAIQANGGTIDLGFMTLPHGTVGGTGPTQTLNQAESFFYLLRSQTGENNGLQTLHKRTSTLCMKRKILASQLIAAIANVALFKADPQICLGEEGIDLIARAQAAAACDDISAILYYAALLSKFNAAGSTQPLPPPWKLTCVVNQVGAKKIARDPTTQADCGIVDCSEVPTIPTAPSTGRTRTSH